MLIKPLISILALIAASGVIRRFKHGAISRAGFLFWIVLWIAAGALVWVPQITNRLATFLGVGRGADAVFYISVILLFYTVFRLFGKLENLEHQLSDLVKKIALRDLDDRR
ncbi:DUF2304 family protein [Candidatus Uhrbacteria bacterium]|nr:DUF2304 family protein [Candidatus Uhrbacteria bacterium]